MSDSIVINSLSELNNDEMYSISGGGWVEALAVGLMSAGVIALTIACPPAGVATGYIVATCVVEGAIGVGSTVLAAKS